MKKRGEATLWILIEFIAALAVLFLSIEIAKELSTGTFFEKLHIAKDISQQINTLASLNGDAYIVYDNLGDYSLKVKGNKIEVFDEESDKVKARYFFAKTKDQNLNLIFDNSNKDKNQLFIYKLENEIKISEQLPEIFK